MSAVAAIRYIQQPHGLFQRESNDGLQGECWCQSRNGPDSGVSATKGVSLPTREIQALRSMRRLFGISPEFSLIGGCTLSRLRHLPLQVAVSFPQSIGLLERPDLSLGLFIGVGECLQRIDQRVKFSLEDPTFGFIGPLLLFLNGAGCCGSLHQQHVRRADWISLKEQSNPECGPQHIRSCARRQTVVLSYPGRSGRYMISESSKKSRGRM